MNWLATYRTGITTRFEGARLLQAVLDQVFQVSSGALRNICWEQNLESACLGLTGFEYPIGAWALPSSLYCDLPLCTFEQRSFSGFDLG